MKEPRNPFRLRASEHIESDTTFLHLFGPGMLDLLPKERLLDNVWILRSAPGGGKTSLMRLFTPNVLLTLHAYRTREECRELYQSMQELGVIDDAGPHLLGVMLSCARNYAALADMGFDQRRQERLLFGLLNARIVIATLRGALALKGLDYPGDLYRLSIVPSPVAESLPGVRLPCNGKEIYDWAMHLETTVCEALDSFRPSQAESLPGHDTLVSLMFMRPESLILDGRPVAERMLFLLDDVHKLTHRQRERLLQTVIELRSPTGLWIAERFEALSTDEMLSSGATEGRDYERVIFLEQVWRDRKKRFERMVLNIADRRARAAADVEINSFGSCLQDSLDGTEWQQQFAQALDTVIARVITLAGMRSLFQEWVAERQAMSGTLRERAIAWRTLEILIEREIEREKRSAQQAFDYALSIDALEEKDDAAVKTAAELFLAHEFGIPYYFGPAKLAVIASSNIEQFLSLAGDEFEELISSVLINKNKPAALTPDRQQVILKKAAQSRLDDIPRRVRHGREVRDFVEAIGMFSRWMTEQPTAPNDPGVNGIAISMADREKLIDSSYLQVHPDKEKLARILASALAHNLLEPVLDYKCKGERWMVLNLNRLLCVHFHLPLNYGKFKEQTLDRLCDWMEQGFKPPRKRDRGPLL
jgi:hypothetical protein